jgi:hypothetical protein
VEEVALDREMVFVIPEIGTDTRLPAAIIVIDLGPAGRRRKAFVVVPVGIDPHRARSADREAVA